MTTRDSWYGRRAPTTSMLTKAGAWVAWNSRSLYPTYDVADDVRELAERRGRAGRMIGWTCFLILLFGAAWKPLLWP